MVGKRTDVGGDPFAWRRDAIVGYRAGASGLARGAVTAVLDLFVIKPIAIFVWGFSQHANALVFRRRHELIRTLACARAAGRPVLVASNHVSWFDDPVIPMALHRTGARATIELLGLAGVGLVASRLPSPIGLVLVVGVGLGVARLGARKTWWTLGDRRNLSDASVLEGKLALTRRTHPGPLLRGLLRLADRAIPWFMRSGATRTIFIERGPGEAAKRARAAAIETALERAAALEDVWVFFEGGRTRTPGVIAPARRGIGTLALGLRDRGLDPLVVVVVHHGMERLIPPGGARFLSTGHRVEVDWRPFDLDPTSPAARDAQAFAEAVRETALDVQRAWHQEQARVA
jgi:1-acyl-sn-glycerol-3-phosphate acyltransferase